MTVPEHLAALFERTPANRTLGSRLVACSAGAATVEWPVGAEHVQEEGRVHGGLITTLADTAAVYALFPDLPADRALTSIELKINFLRAVHAERGPVVARSSVVRSGRRVALVDVEVTQEGRLVAKGSFTYLFLERE